MASDKVSIRRLVEICRQKGIRHIVFSPGSRNAPLTITFNAFPEFKCYTITDERSAAFFALGIAQRLREPVVICCTSGTAALNYAPAIAEAYYQGVPLLVITADRPVEWKDQGAGQTINQTHIYRNYVVGSYELTQEALHRDDLWRNDLIINEAINRTVSDMPGPVHINVPLREPLYDQVQAADENVRIISAEKVLKTLSSGQAERLRNTWRRSEKKMMLVGLRPPVNGLAKDIDMLIDKSGLVVVTETTSNLACEKTFPCIDRLITTIPEDSEDAYAPDLLITFGGPIVSKKIKALLRRMSPDQHWHIDPSGIHLDTFQSLTEVISMDPERFVSLLNSWEDSGHAHVAFFKLWHRRHLKTQANHAAFLENCAWSDLKVFDIVLNNLDNGTTLHMGNSTVVRYIQLFDQHPHLTYYSNRGVSGIDGCTSTAIGSAHVSDNQHVLITGDLAFFYDSNAFWNNYLSSNLKVILINNAGGSIFRIIPGPSSTKEFETYFEAYQQMHAEPLAQLNGLEYTACAREGTFRQELKTFFAKKTTKPAILEVFTPRKDNDVILAEYFDYLKK